MANPKLPRDMRRLAQGYQIGAAGGVIRTPVGGGRPRYGLDWNRGVQQFQISMILNRSQFQIWSIFYHRVIQKGAITFDMSLDSGMGNEPHAVNIVPETYSAARTGAGYTSISFVVEAESSTYALSDEEVALYLELYEGSGPALGGLINRLAQFANVDLTSAFGGD